MSDVKVNSGYTDIAEVLSELADTPGLSSKNGFLLGFVAGSIFALVEGLPVRIFSAYVYAIRQGLDKIGLDELREIFDEVTADYEKRNYQSDSEGVAENTTADGVAEKGERLVSAPTEASPWASEVTEAEEAFEHQSQQ